MRDLATNKSISLQDDYLKQSQLEKRERCHTKSKPLNVKYETGDTVMIKDQMTKTKPREKFVIMDPGEGESCVTIQKQDKKFNARQYNVPKYQLLKVPRAAALKARKKIADVAPLCYVELDVSVPPIHAFNDSDEDDNDQDWVYYTPHKDVCDRLESGSLDSSSSCQSTSTEDSMPDDHNCLCGVDAEMERETLQVDVPGCNQQLDDLIRNTSQFLSQHPRAPEAPRRSRRIRSIPRRYL